MLEIVTPLARRHVAVAIASPSHPFSFLHFKHLKTLTPKFIQTTTTLPKIRHHS